MYNFRYLIGASVFVLMSSAFAGGPEVSMPAQNNSGIYLTETGGINFLAGSSYVNRISADGTILYESRSNPYNGLGWNIGGAVGYHFNAFRLEVEAIISRRSARLNSIANIVQNQLRVSTLMANAYYDFNLDSRFIPFVGLGLGWAHVQSGVRVNSSSLNNFNFNWNQNSLALQGILGLDYRITRKVRVGISYHALAWGLGDTSRMGTLPIASTITGNSISFNSRSGFRCAFENKINLEIGYFFY